MPRHLFVIGLTANLTVALGSANAQAPQPDRLFGDQTPLELTLTAPLRQLGRDTRENRERRPGTVVYHEADGREITLDIDVRVRGRTRLAECNFPPLRLSFTDVQTEGTIFEGQSHLKLVTLCRARDLYRDYLAEEFLIYRMLNALTDVSFRVRWVEIEYVSSDGRNDPFVESAFLIEDVDEVAERTGLEVLDHARVRPEELDRSHLSMLTVFQYVIANTDFSFLRAAGDEPCCHNGWLLGSGDDPMLVLAYDFDQAGLINTEYAVPSPTLSIDRVTQRVYRGFCELNSDLDGGIQRVLAARASLEAILDDTRVRERARERALKYLRESLDRISDADTVQRDMIEKCRAS